LRWQRPDQPNGFYGIKDNIIMRTAANPKHHKVTYFPDAPFITHLIHTRYEQIEWEKWSQASRHQISEELTNTKLDEFDTTIVMKHSYSSILQ
jgi:predicted carbohydrate-binding protein with CBM5 and CBM33 domain